MKKRMLSVLLCLVMVVGLMPTAAFAAGTDTGKAIQLGTGGISGYDSGYDYIYYGKWYSDPIKWRVLDDQTNTGESGLFLLTDKLLGTGTYGDVYFDNSGNSNEWQNSTAQAWCKDFAGESGAAENVTNAFTDAELGAILATTKRDEAFTNSQNSVLFAASENILNGDKVFFLSAEEAENSTYGFTDNHARIANYGDIAGVWWLRSPGAHGAHIDYYAGAVLRDGSVAHLDVFHDWAARPAFNLDLNSVLFTSAASGGGTGGEAAGAIFEIGDYNGNEWKLTLKDTSRTFSVKDTTAATRKPGDTITLNYAGATVGANEYISVMIADSSGNATHYGRIMQPTDVAGTVNITIPSGLADGTYTLNVFSEQYNGDYKTDYASAFQTVTLTVDTIPPTLSTGSATRDSEANATVKFTSSEAGIYYYEVVEKSAAALSIDTTAAGTACTNGENTISLTSLSGTAAKDIYIVAKDAAGNVSSSLKVEIPAYVAPVYSISADTTTLNFGSVQTGYTTPAAQTITVTNTGNQQITLTQPTASNYTVGALSKTTLAAGETATFTVQPKEGLVVKNHNETLTVSGSDGASAQVQLSFAVNKAEQDAPAKPELDSRTKNSITLKAIPDNANGAKAQYRMGDGDWQDSPAFTGLSSGTEYSFTARYAETDNYNASPASEAATFSTNSSSGGVSTYTVTVKDSENGTVTADRRTASYGATVTLTVKPEQGWTLETLTAANASGKEVELTIVKVGETYTFQMPSSNVTVNATFMEDNTMLNYFVDVSAGDYYYDAVLWAAVNGITSGVDALHFAPDASCTRGQIVTFLWRAAGSPEPQTMSGFADVAADSYCAKAVAWAVERGITSGTGNGRFSPDEACTRAQAVTFLYRAAGSPAVSGYAEFDDVMTDAYYAGAVAWATEQGVTEGVGSRRFAPDDTCTRGQIVTFLWRSQAD